VQSTLSIPHLLLRHYCAFFRTLSLWSYTRKCCRTFFSLGSRSKNLFPATQEFWTEVSASFCHLCPKFQSCSFALWWNDYNFWNKGRSLFKNAE